VCIFSRGVNIKAVKASKFKTKTSVNFFIRYNGKWIKK